MIKVKQNAFGVGDNYAIVSGSSPCEAKKRSCGLNPLLNDSYVCLIFYKVKVINNLFGGFGITMLKWQR